ncbi:phosphonate C-P lyase system protein PhnG [Paenibacillus peoriae]|uniref:phosphonate C-P lyase system protein PhnG n=1 Tax=Paenibacillus peoriae TaxID=59893 RepID=UPI0002E0FA74|nr:phosphonate C-P lyase system protein PhnG [Paenibacillus peoriae]MEC0184769.1 phosphonate C-P lyase system protein PhnG [Paenibacillus peoriae]
MQAQGAAGIGLIRGDDSEKAYFLAIIDALRIASSRLSSSWFSKLASQGPE